MAILDIHVDVTRAETVEHEWTTKDRLIWSAVAAIAIYAVFYGFLKLMNFALGGT